MTATVSLYSSHPLTDPVFLLDDLQTKAPFCLNFSDVHCFLIVEGSTAGGMTMSSVRGFGSLANLRLSGLTAAIYLLSCLFALSFSPPVFADGKPNILVIFGDDVGQTDISAYSMGLMGFKTPNIDRIAKSAEPDTGELLDRSGGRCGEKENCSYRSSSCTFEARLSRRAVVEKWASW